MAPRPEARTPLEVQGSLHLESPGGATLVLDSAGDRLQLRATTFGDLRRALEALPGGPRRSPLLRRLDHALRATTLRVEVLLGGRLIASLGTDSQAGLLSRLLGLGPVAVYPAGVLAGMLMRRG
jgi:hypothetical protein